MKVSIIFWGVLLFLIACAAFWQTGEVVRLSNGSNTELESDVELDEPASTDEVDDPAPTSSNTRPPETIEVLVESQSSEELDSHLYYISPSMTKIYVEGVFDSKAGEQAITINVPGRYQDKYIFTLPMCTPNDSKVTANLSTSAIARAEYFVFEGEQMEKMTHYHFDLRSSRDRDKLNWPSFRNLHRAFSMGWTISVTGPNGSDIENRFTYMISQSTLTNFFDVYDRGGERIDDVENHVFRQGPMVLISPGDSENSWWGEASEIYYYDIETTYTSLDSGSDMRVYDRVIVFSLPEHDFEFTVHSLVGFNDVDLLEKWTGFFFDCLILEPLG